MRGRRPVRDLGSYFSPDRRGGILVYDCTDCDACGAVMQEANASHVTNMSPSAAESAGLTRLDVAPPEGGWSDEADGATCGCC